jgi:hypothetical protein
MTDEEKRFDRREKARLDDMYDAQCETKGDDMTEDFNKWWNADGLVEDNPYERDTPAFWAWEGWQAGAAAEREWQGLTEDEIAQLMFKCDVIVTGPTQFDFANAIEAKLKEKNFG